MKRIVLLTMLIGGAILSTQAQGRRDYRGGGNGRGYEHRGGPRYEREYCRPAPHYGGYYGGRGVYCAPAPRVVYYEAPCPPPPPPPRVYYPRGPRVVIAAGPVVVGF